MREIKFRAWDIESERMIIPDNSTGEYIFDFIDGGIRVKTEETQWREGGGETYEVDAWVEVHVELMQFTGIQIDGVDLYEGDIVEYMKEDKSGFRERHGMSSDAVNSEVFFRGGSFMIYIDNQKSQYIELSQTGSDYPILGNKFENPDLLK